MDMHLIWDFPSSIIVYLSNKLHSMIRKENSLVYSALYKIIKQLLNSNCQVYSYTAHFINFILTLSFHCDSSKTTTYVVDFFCHWHFSKEGTQDSRAEYNSSSGRWFVSKMHNEQL